MQVVIRTKHEVTGSIPKEQRANWKTNNWCNSPDLFKHHFLWGNHLPDAVEVISTDSKCFLSHFTLVAAGDRHCGYTVILFPNWFGNSQEKVARLQYGGSAADGNEFVSRNFGGYICQGEKIMNQKLMSKRTMNGYNRPIRLRKNLPKACFSVSTDPTVLVSSRFTTVFASGVFTSQTR